VLALCILRASMSSIGLPPYVQDVATGAVLLGVALLDAEDLVRRLHPFRAKREVPSTTHGEH
jgi:ribose/xylose/arabinose/galactoside ABC-type transport system permease subunit